MNIVINHILIRTAKLEAMIAFFEQILMLKKGERPAFPFKGAWLWSDNKPIIHLTESKPHDHGQIAYLGESNHSSEGTGIIDHIAFSGTDYQALISRLKRFDTPYFERTVPTGEHQVFIEGPEGLRIEVQFEAIND